MKATSKADTASGQILQLPAIALLCLGLVLSAMAHRKQAPTPAAPAPAVRSIKPQPQPVEQDPDLEMLSSTVCEVTRASPEQLASMTPEEVRARSAAMGARLRNPATELTVLVEASPGMHQAASGDSHKFWTTATARLRDLLLTSGGFKKAEISFFGPVATTEPTPPTNAEPVILTADPPQPSTAGETPQDGVETLANLTTAQFLKTLRDPATAADWQAKAQPVASLLANFAQKVDQAVTAHEPPPLLVIITREPPLADDLTTHGLLKLPEDLLLAVTRAPTILQVLREPPLPAPAAPPPPQGLVQTFGQLSPGSEEDPARLLPGIALTQWATLQARDHGVVVTSDDIP